MSQAVTFNSSTEPRWDPQPAKHSISKEVFNLLSPIHKIVAECLIRKGEWVLVEDTSEVAR